ncbi:MAG: glycogen/starch synthase, partial [Candidatus Woesearchaeota archaeon]
SAGVTNTLLNYIKPDMVWLNDWMTGPVAPVAKALGIKVITTGHNIFTKTAPLDYLIHRGIELRDSDDYTPMKWVWKNNDQFDFMASAINPADDFLTVSEGFLERLLKGDIDYLAPSVTDAIKKKSYSKHADGRSRVHGYLNPLERDKSTFLESVKNYGLEETIDWRKKNGEELRQMVGLKAGGRLVVFPNRAYSQKNPKLVIDNAIRLARNHDLRILFLCNGDSNVIDNMKEVALGSNGYVAYQSFDKKIEKKVKGSDNTYGLMTSEFEPCGGPNLNYPLEGILIGAHSIDGLKDTVKSINVTNNTGNGFPYNDNNSGGLDYCISEMIKFANLDDNTRYGHLIRIANEHLTKYASAPRMKRLVEEIFLPLYHEKYKKM